MGPKRLIINPGGVGQPRDRNPRSSYAVYDSGSKTIFRHRVSYDITKMQNKVRAVGLPGHLIDRLGHGL